MKRIACLIILTALSSPASARDSYFTFRGHRVHIHSERHCRWLSCVQVSVRGVGNRSRDRSDDVAATSDQAPQQTPAAAPAPPTQPLIAPSPAPSPAPLPPLIAQAATPVTRTPNVAAPAAVPAAPTARLATGPETTASTPPPPGPAVGFEMPKPPPGAASARVQQSAPTEKANAGLQQKPIVQTPAAATQAPPPAPQVARAANENEDDRDTPLGDWQTDGKNGLVRIEACGAALCGYVLNATTREKGETILVNMKPKSGIKWSGNIYSRSSGNSYYGTMTLKESNTLHVEACALGQFFCSGNDWTRIEEGRSARQHELATSRPPANRS